MKNESVSKRARMPWGWLFIAGYVIVSLLYQAWGFVLDHAGYTVVEPVTVSPCYQFKVRLPNQIPVAAMPSTGQARPITIWGWKKEDTACSRQSDEVVILFKDRNNLIFTDNQQAESAASLTLQMGKTEEQAVRQSVYVYVPMTDKKIKKVSLSMEMFGVTSKSWVMDVQSPATSGLFRLLNLLFGMPVVTAITTTLAIGKFLLEEQEKKLKHIEEFETNLNMLGAKVEQIGSLTLEFYEKTRRNKSLEGLVNKLRERFEKLRRDNESGNLWSFGLRQKIVSHLGQDDFESWAKNIPEWIKYTDEEDKDKYNFLIWFSKWLQNESGELNAEVLENTLFVFNAIGKNAREVIVKKIKDILNKRTPQQSKPDLEIINLFAAQWYEHGGAAGRYLLSRIDHPSIQIKLRELNSSKPLPPNKINPPLWPWPDKVRFQPPYDVMARWPDRNPFGPIHAEDDLRLPWLPPSMEVQGENELFWDKHPVWEKSISAPTSAIYLVGHGMGTTTFIWMGRRERRFWGIKPAFSLYAQLAGAASEGKVWQGLEASLIESLLVSLAEDPYWLLDASNIVQEQIGKFLLFHYQSDMTRLLKSLGNLDMPGHEQMIFADILVDIQSAPDYRREGFPHVLKSILDAMGDAAMDRLAPGEGFKCYFWIEIKSAPALQDWLSMFQTLGLDSMGMLKIFSTSSPKSVSKKFGLPPIPVTWKEGELEKLLIHRIDGSFKMEGWQNYLPDVTIEQLVNAADKSPQRLIQKGNDALIASLRKSRRPGKG